MDYYLIEFFHSRKVGTLNFNIALRLQKFFIQVDDFTQSEAGIHPS